MTWNAPMTAISGSIFTAAQFNTFLRDNLNECPAAKATTPGSIFATSDTNQVSERIPATDFTTNSDSVTSTSYADVATVGPRVSVVTGSSALVTVTGRVINNTAGQNTYINYDVSGATTIAANDDNAYMFTCPVINYSQQGSSTMLLTGLTPGTNTFTMKYRVTGGTGTVDNRRLTVIPF